MDLDDLSRFKQLDPQDMLAHINGLPEQLQSAWELSKTQPFEGFKFPKGSLQQVVVCGMGGSAIGADLVAAAVMDTCPVPVLVHRDYGLPGFAKGAGTLVEVLLGCCGGIYILAFSFLMPALLIHYARTNSFSAMFQVGEVFKLATGNIGEYLMAWLTGLIAWAVLGVVSPVLLVLCIIPYFIGVAWVTSVSYYAYGQVGLTTIAQSQM